MTKGRFAGRAVVLLAVAAVLGWLAHSWELFWLALAANAVRLAIDVVTGGKLERLENIVVHLLWDILCILGNCAVDAVLALTRKLRKDYRYARGYGASRRTALRIVLGNWFERWRETSLSRRVGRWRINVEIDLCCIWLSVGVQLHLRQFLLGLPFLQLVVEYK